MPRNKYISLAESAKYDVSTMHTSHIVRRIPDDNVQFRLINCRERIYLGCIKTVITVSRTSACNRAPTGRLVGWTVRYQRQSTRGIQAQLFDDIFD